MIVGIDIGTQSVKAVVTDSRLSVMGEGVRPYAPAFPRPGWAQQDPAVWEAGLGPAVAEALQNARVEPFRIRALGVAGQLDGCVPVGPGGEAVGDCLIWMDRRAVAELAAVRGLEAAAFRRTTGITLDAGHMAAKILWLDRHLPDRSRAVRFHQPVSYLVARLTGAHVIDHATASTTMLYSLETADYDDGLLERFGIRRSWLPEIADAWTPAGELSARGAALTGLTRGIPVAVGTGDDFSTTLGAGLVRPGRLACVLGTAEVVGALDTRPRIDHLGLVETHRYFGGTYFIENPGWLSGGALEWFVKTFRLADVRRMVALAETAPAGSQDLQFLPALSGAMAPEWVPSARAGFYGLTPAHGTAHMARAVLEGCAFAMRDVIERLTRMEVPVESILLLGGGARSRLWAQIRADVSRLPAAVPDLLDTSPVGAAMLAAVAAGIQPDLAACAGKVDRPAVTVTPDPGRGDAYDAAYAAYGRLFACLKPMFG